MRELGLVGVIRGLVGSTPPCGRPENGIATSARILVLIKRVQIVMIHYPLGYDVKAERVVNHHYLYPLDQNK